MGAAPPCPGCTWVATQGGGCQERLGGCCAGALTGVATQPWVGGQEHVAGVTAVLGCLRWPEGAPAVRITGFMLLLQSGLPCVLAQPSASLRVFAGRTERYCRGGSIGMESLSFGGRACCTGAGQRRQCRRLRCMPARHCFCSERWDRHIGIYIDALPAVGTCQRECAAALYHVERGSPHCAAACGPRLFWQTRHASLRGASIWHFPSPAPPSPCLDVSARLCHGGGAVSQQMPLHGTATRTVGEHALGPQPLAMPMPAGCTV